MLGHLYAAAERERLVAFVADSNLIEGIDRDPTPAEVHEHERLLARRRLTVQALEQFVHVATGGAPLRRDPGQNVYIRGAAHRPPPGGPLVEQQLRVLLDEINAGALTPFWAHVRYERLHPFTDGNGRSGRAVWAWHMRRDGRDPFALPVLQRLYYDALDAVVEPT